MYAQATGGEEETGRPAKKGRHKRSWEEASSDEEEDAAEQERQKVEQAREKDQAEKAEFEERLKAKVCLRLTQLYPADCNAPPTLVMLGTYDSDEPDSSSLPPAAPILPSLP